MPNVVIISDDILPKSNISARAAGIRAWGIGQGLKAHGLDVIYAVRTRWWPSDEPLPAAEKNEIYWNSKSELNNILRNVQSHALVNCSFPSILPSLANDRVIIQDSNGPRLFEAIFRRPELSLKLAWAEASSYVSSDYFICTSQGQRNYFYPFLLLSGFDLSDTSRILVVRLGYDGSPIARHPEPKRLFFGGRLLPWTDPRFGWSVAGSEVAKWGGLLVMVTSVDREDRATQPLVSSLDEMRKLACCVIKENISHQEYRTELARCVAVMDVMAYNPERALAVPTRTVEYLWAGIPPIIPNYGELGQLVSEFGAGWVLTADNEDQIRRAVREALNDNELVCQKSEAAQRLHTELFSPYNTTRELATLCISGSKRPHSRVPSSSNIESFITTRLSALLRRLSGIH